MTIRKKTIISTHREKVPKRLLSAGKSLSQVINLTVKEF